MENAISEAIQKPQTDGRPLHVVASGATNRLLLTFAAMACLAFAVSAHGQVARTPVTFDTADGPVKITPIFHASTLLEANGKAIILDPYSMGNFSGIPLADLILISHTHADHMDPGEITAMSKPSTEIWAPAVVAKTVTTAKIIANGQVKKWDRWTIEAVPAYNIKNGDRHKKGEDNGYILTYGGKRFYFSADTEGTPEMRALKNIDVAFICMNGPTMTAEEAADAVRAFHPKIAIPYHFRGTDLNVFQRGLQGSGVEVRILDYYPKTNLPS
jgi:L-ascorbate metabolism protein UlaG (beta-lactamase superfamily)